MYARPRVSGVPGQARTPIVKIVGDVGGVVQICRQTENDHIFGNVCRWHYGLGIPSGKNKRTYHSRGLGIWVVVVPLSSWDSCCIECLGGRVACPDEAVAQ